MASRFNQLLLLTVAALTFVLPLGTVLIIRGAESQYARVLFTGADSILIVLVVCGAWQCIRSARYDHSLRNAVAGVGMVVLSAVFSLLTIPEPSLAHAAIVLRLAVASCAALCIAGMPSHKNTALTVLFFAGVLQAGYAIVQFAMQHIDPIPLLGVSAHSSLNLGDAVVQTAQVRFLRAYGTFAHPNILAAFLGICSIVGIALLSAARNAIHRSLLLGGSFIVLVGILLTFSRGVWLALIIAVIASHYIDRWYALRMPPQSVITHSSLRILVVGALVICSIFIFFFADVVASRLGITGEARLETRSVEERIISAKDALSVIRNNPFGVGIGNYVPYLMEKDRQAGTMLPAYRYQPVHSHVLLIFAELGVIGLAAFFFLFTALVVVIKKRFRAFAYERHFFRLICGIGLFLFVSGLFDHAYWTIPSGIILWWFSIGILLRTRFF